MNLSDYVEMQGRYLGELGDATDDLQAIVDAGLRIPSGFYHLEGRVRLHGPHPGSGEAGHSAFIHAEPARMTCRACGTAFEWLAPFKLAAATLWCRQCAAPMPHDEVESDPPPRSAQEIWDAGHTLEGNYDSKA